jgi:hypothetical protein
VINAEPQQSLPLGSELTPGFVWNGKQLVRKPAPDPRTAWMAEVKQNSLDDILRQIGVVQGEISTGNRRPGPDWLPGFTTPYAEQLQKLEARRNALTAGAAPASATPSGPVRAPTTLSPQDQQALTWARSNSDDPRAAKILAKLGFGSGTAAPSPTPGASVNGTGRKPQMGDRRTINGVLAEWDGKGWLPAAP